MLPRCVRYVVLGLLLVTHTLAYGSGWTGGGVPASGPGSGNVSSTGTPTSGQVALWTNATTLQGLTALPCANLPALTGDVTTSAGSCATTLASIPALSGANLTNLPAANLTGTIASAVQDGITRTGTLVSGATGAGFTLALSTSTVTETLADARLSSNVALRDSATAFSVNQTAPAFLATGTGGAGYLQLANQSSAPGTPTSAARLYMDTSNRLSWIGTNGFTRTFDGTANTANRIYVLPDLAGTVALTTNNLSIFAPTTSAQLRGVLSDPTGTGAAVFADSPTFTTKITTPALDAFAFTNIGTATETATYLNAFATTGVTNFIVKAGAGNVIGGNPYMLKVVKSDNTLVLGASPLGVFVPGFLTFADSSITYPASRILRNSFNALDFVIESPTDNAGHGAFNMELSGGFTITSGTTSYMWFGNVAGTSTTGFYPSSGNAIFNGLWVNWLINQTGGASGITRGIYVNPTITSAADYRALEIASGPIAIANDTFLQRNAAGNWQLGRDANNAPVAQTFSVQDGAGTDIAGVPFTIRANRATGMGTPGVINLAASAAALGTGTTLQTAVTHLAVGNGAVTLGSSINLQQSNGTVRITDGGVFRTSTNAAGGSATCTLAGILSIVFEDGLFKSCS